MDTNRLQELAGIELLTEATTNKWIVIVFDRTYGSDSTKTIVQASNASEALQKALKLNDDDFNEQFNGGKDINKGKQLFVYDEDETSYLMFPV